MGVRFQRRSGRGSFRGRMILFSVLVSAVGLAGFAFLSLGFFHRELRRNLEKDLSAALVRSVPILVRLSEGDREPLEERMAARIEGWLDQFGAVYAVRRMNRSDWILSSEWPERKTAVLDRTAERLPPATFPQGWSRQGWRTRNPLSGERQRPPRGERDTPPGLRSNIRVFRPEGWPGDWLVAGVRNDRVAVMLAVPADLNRGEVRRLLAVFLIAGPLALILVGVGAFFLAGRALLPIRRLTEVAGNVTATDLSARIGTDGMEREFRELIEVFNGMLGRLERSFFQARRFGHDAAHELNTPLTVLTARLDEALSSADAGSPAQVQLAEIGEEIDRMKEIVRKLELLSRIDGGGFHPAAEPMDLRAVAEETVSEIAEIFPDIDFCLEEGGALETRADRGLVRQILLNLLSNGARYNREGGRVTVSMKQSRGQTLLEVENTGPAIPEELRERIFDRFSRGDVSRERTDGGLGLGLSLAMEFARAMNGDLRLVSPAEDAIRFELELPGAGKRENSG